MIARQLGQFTFCILMLCFASLAKALAPIDESVYFPNSAQGHAVNGSCSNIFGSQLTQYGRSQIKGTYGVDLPFCTINTSNERPDSSCDDSAGNGVLCNVSGSPTPELNLDNFKNNNGGSSIDYCDSGERLFIDNPNTQKISLYSNCTLEFDSSRTEYRVNSLAMGSNAEVILHTGDYWFNSLQLNGSSKIITNGNVRIFVNGNIALNTAATIEASINSNVQVIGYSGAALEGDTQITGDLYISETLNLYNSARIVGRTNSRKLIMTDDAIIEGSNTLSSNPVMWLKMDEDSWDNLQGTVADSSGNNLHGRAINGASTAQNSPALPEINNLGTCGYGEFTHARNQYVEVPYDSKLDLDKELTISAWVYPKSRPNRDLYSILSKDNNYEFHINSAGYVYWWWQEKNGSTRSLASTSRIPNDQWSHVTIRYNFKNSSASIFINGVLAGSRTSNQNKQLQTNNLPLQIGQDQNFSGRAFDGHIDEVLIFNRSLTDQQVWDLYNQRHLCGGLTPSCFTDDFQSKPLDEQWRVFSSSGAFTPSIVNQRLRLTQAVRNQATASTFQRIFPAANNKIDVEFDYFAYGGSGADGVAIVFSDASITPQVGAFGGPLGYGYKTYEQKPGFAGGWLGIGIDEFGNYSIEGGPDGPGRRRQAVALRGSGSGYSGYGYLAGTCNNGSQNSNGDCLNPKIDSNNGNPLHRYQISIDSTQSGVSNVTIKRKVGSNNWETLIGPINVLSFAGQSNVPDELLLSITGSTGGSTNYHEIDNFEVCALDSRPVGEQINHFRISLPAQGLTCAASDVSIKACADDNCNNLFTDPVTAYLIPNSLPSASGGWVDGSTLSFSNGVGNAQLRRNSAGNVTVGVSGSIPTAIAFNDTLCSHNGDAGPFSTNNCTITFADSGFILDVPNSYANQTVAGTIKAVRKDNASQQCLPSFQNVPKSVSFWSDYLSPSAGQGFTAYTVGVNNVAVGQSSNSSVPVTLNFNQNGEASISVSYRDAGSLALNARFDGSGEEQDLTLTGQDSFVRVPRALVLSATNYYGNDGACPSADMSCNIFARADENFNLHVKAVAAEPVEDNDFTNNLGVTNYQQTNIELSHTLIEPATGVPGNLGEVEYNHQLGSSTTVLQKVSEVGAFDFSLLSPTSYLGVDLLAENLPITMVSTGPVGRFIPAYFSPTSVVASLKAECKLTSSSTESFSYLGQPFGYQENPGVYLNPRSALGSKTVNYFDSTWWRYNQQWDNRVYEDTVHDLSISFDKDATSVNRINAGDSRIELLGEELIYQKPPQAIVPFNSKLELTLAASDLTDLDGVCYRATASSPCIDYTIADIDNEMKLRWGKLVIHDTYGPETAPLLQQVVSEYYSTNGFVINSFDSCTQLPDIANFTLTATDLTLGSGGPPAVEATLKIESRKLSSGVTTINFSAPGAGEQGFIDTLLDLDANGLPWLRIDEDQDGSFENSVSGRVQFGLYRGSDRVIWWRERN